MVGGGVVGWLHVSKSLLASVSEDHVPSSPWVSSFSCCLSLIYYWSMEFDFSMIFFVSLDRSLVPWVVPAVFLESREDQGHSTAAILEQGELTFPERKWHSLCNSWSRAMIFFQIHLPVRVYKKVQLWLPSILWLISNMKKICSANHGPLGYCIVSTGKTFEISFRLLHFKLFSH